MTRSPLSARARMARHTLAVSCGLVSLAAAAGSLLPVSRDAAATDLRTLGFTKVAPNSTVPTLTRPDEAGFNLAYAPTFLGQSYAVDEATGVGTADNGIPSWRPQDQGWVLERVEQTALRDPLAAGATIGQIVQQAWRKPDGAVAFAYRVRLADVDRAGEVPDYQINYLRLVGYAPADRGAYSVQVGWVMSQRVGQFGFQAAAFTDVTASSGNAGEFYTSASRCTTLAGCPPVALGEVSNLRPLSGSQYRADTLNFRLDLEPLEGYADTGWMVVDTNASGWRRIAGNTTYLDGATSGGATNLVSFTVLGPAGPAIVPNVRRR